MQSNSRLVKSCSAAAKLCTVFLNTAQIWEKQKGPWRLKREWLQHEGKSTYIKMVEKKRKKSPKAISKALKKPACGVL